MDARAAINGIQEVSGSIPLISTKTVENLVFSTVFLCFAAIFATFLERLNDCRI